MCARASALLGRPRSRRPRLYYPACATADSSSPRCCCLSWGARDSSGSCELRRQHLGRLRHHQDRLLWSLRCWCGGRGVEVERAMYGKGRSTRTRCFGSVGGRGRPGLGPCGQGWKLCEVEVDDSWWSVNVLGPFQRGLEHRRL